MSHLVVFFFFLRAVLRKKKIVHQRRSKVFTLVRTFFDVQGLALWKGPDGAWWNTADSSALFTGASHLQVVAGSCCVESTGATR